METARPPDDEHQAYRDLWLSECWKPVPEWHPTKDERLAAAARNQALNRAAPRELRAS